MPDGVSVIICCHNSAQRLPATLTHLAAQQARAGILWEVVVVDNASTDDTAQTATHCWTGSAAAKLRVVHESQPGLSNARIRGLREARYEIVSFIDDDNWVSPDWVDRLSRMFSTHPEIGACGGRIEAVCEVTPPEWFESIRQHYAVGRQHEKSGEVTHAPGTLLWGAGLSLRAVAVRKLLEDGFVFRMSDRKGKLLSSGGDTELCFALRASGWRFWYDDELEMRHFIPKERLRWDYALGLMRGIGESSALITLYLLALHGPPLQDYPAWKRSWLFQFSKALRQVLFAVVSHPEDWFGAREGSPAVLRAESAKGHLAALWMLCGRYEKLQGAIQQSAWVKH